MRELKGETTVFYSHPHPRRRPAGQRPRRDPRRRPARPGRPDRRALLESFERDQLRVVVGGGDDATGVDLAAIPGVASVEPVERDGELRTYLLRVQPGATTAVQREITRFGADHDLTLIENHLVRLDLEDVFLRLIDTKERAA